MSTAYGEPPLCNCKVPMPCIIGAMGRRKAWACAAQPDDAKCDFFQWVVEASAATATATKSPTPEGSPLGRSGSPSRSPSVGPIKRTTSKIHSSPRAAPYAGSPARSGHPGIHGHAAASGHSFPGVAALGQRGPTITGRGGGLGQLASMSSKLAGMPGAPPPPGVGGAAARALGGHHTIVQTPGKPPQAMAPAVIFSPDGTPDAEATSASQSSSSSRPSPIGSMGLGMAARALGKSPSPGLGSTVPIGAASMSQRSPARSGIPKLPPPSPRTAGLGMHAIAPPGQPAPPLGAGPSGIGHASIVGGGTPPMPNRNMSTQSFTADGKTMAPAVVFTPDGTPTKHTMQARGVTPSPPPPGPDLITPLCECGKPADKMTSQSMKNFGRIYFRCLTCKFFEWGPPLRAASEPPGVPPPPPGGGHAGLRSALGALGGHASIAPGGDASGRPPMAPGSSSHGLPPRSPAFPMGHAMGFAGMSPRTPVVESGSPAIMAGQRLMRTGSGAAVPGSYTAGGMPPRDGSSHSSVFEKRKTNLDFNVNCPPNFSGSPHRQSPMAMAALGGMDIDTRAGTPPPGHAAPEVNLTFASAEGGPPKDGDGKIDVDLTSPKRSPRADKEQSPAKRIAKAPWSS